MILKSKWITGTVEIGIIDQLPIDNVDMIIGNNLAGFKIAIISPSKRGERQQTSKSILNKKDIMTGIVPASLSSSLRNGRRSRMKLKNK